MKRKLCYMFLAAEGICCLALYTVRSAFAAWFTAAMAFPFEQIGLLLRKLSLSGNGGNAAAIVLYLLLSLLPVLFLPFLHRKRRLCPEDGLLVLSSAVLLVSLYLMVNPSLLNVWLGETGPAMGKAMLGGAVYALFSTYAVLRLLRLFSAADASRLRRYGKVLLWVLIAVFVFLAFGPSFGALLDSFEHLRAGNTDGGLGLTYAFLVLQYLVDALPYVLDVWVAFSGLDLLEEAPYSERAVNAAEQLARRCGRALAWTVLSNCGFNLLQLLAARRLRVISGTVQLPVFSVAFVLAALLLARLFRENKRLKDDNDLFV